jgi:3-oxoacyl-[acyl-carrier-protein] synthase-1
VIAAITATGAVTSVGYTASASCAAIRADVSRPHPIEVPFVDAETQELVPLTGHPVAGYTDGFQLLGRWLRLARGAMADLLAQPGVPPVEDAAFWGRTALVAVTPRPDDDVFLTEPGGALAAIQADFVGRLSTVLRIPFAPSGVELVARGHAGAILAAEAWFARLGTKVDRVLVLAVDSLLDPLLLQKLAADRRLKSDDEPNGLMPGEAAAAFLVETPPSVRRRGVRAQAAILGAASGVEAAGDGGEPACSGRALASSLTRLLDGLQPTRPFSGDLVLDLTGESWRARDWGSALVRMGRGLGDHRLHLPATSIGDTGAASGALGICFGVHLLRRGVARGDVVVLSRSDAGEVACLALGHPS